MQRFKPALSLAVLVVAGAATLCGAAAPAPPSAAKIRQVVTDFFASVPGYRDGDVIDQAQVAVLLKELKAIGCQAAQLDPIVARVPLPDEWLVVELRTAAGRPFMRQVARYPGAYDRLDRLSVMPHGKQTIRDLTRGPDGYKMIEYLTMRSGGREMGNMLSRTPTGAGFNRPTGRVYTAEALIRELEKAVQPVKGRGAPT